jgi:sugar phosphate isomerase/epimerase
MGSRVFHTHVKDVWWSPNPTDAGVFGGHVEFGHPDRHWDFRSPGHGRIDFDAVFRGLLLAGYQGPLSVEWEDPHMDREHGAAEAVGFVRRMQFPKAGAMFDEAFRSS